MRSRGGRVRDAARRLTAILVRAERLRVDPCHLRTSDLLKHAYLHQQLLTLLLSLLVAAVLLGCCVTLANIPSCGSNNKTQEIHIPTMRWDRLPPDGQTEDTTPASWDGLDIEDHEETPLWRRDLRLLRER